MLIDPRTGRHIDPTSTHSLDPLLEAARNHGELSDSTTHEVGDLTACLIACWLEMRCDQRQGVLDQFEYLMAEWLDGPPA